MVLLRVDWDSFFYFERRSNMGKNLKARELGVGLSQRKDGLYSARLTLKNGRRIERYFSTLKEAKSWLQDAKYEDKHGVRSMSLKI